MPEAGGYSKTTRGRSAFSASSEKCRTAMSGLSWAPHMKSVGGKTSTPRRPQGLGVPRQLHRLLSAVGVDTGHHRAAVADLLQRDGQRPLALFTGERRHLGGVAV